MNLKEDIMYDLLEKKIRRIYPDTDKIPLLEPVFLGGELENLQKAIASSFVSSQGDYLIEAELEIKKITGSSNVVLVNSGTAALHLALSALNCNSQSCVIAPSFTYAATVNAVVYTGAKPVFLDIELDTFGLCPLALKTFLENKTYQKNNKCFDAQTNLEIKACIPVHTFGNPLRIEEICKLCSLYNIHVVEDAAESLGSFSKSKHTGTIGDIGILSFNGNKIVTAGNGGAILCKDIAIAKRIKHISNHSKISSQGYDYDGVGFNYRLSNINAALLLAELNNLKQKLINKQKVHVYYKNCFKDKHHMKFLSPTLKLDVSNHWVNVIELPTKSERDKLVELLNAQQIQLNKSWSLLHDKKYYNGIVFGEMKNSIKATNTLALLPSSYSHVLAQNHSI